MKHTHTIDAQGKRLGRIATEAARFLRGKHRPDFTPHQVSNQHVHIINTQHMNIEEAKLKGKIYTRYSGYPGGLKRESMENVAAVKGYTEIVRRAIFGMLPNNKLRNKIMKQLVITD